MKERERYRGSMDYRKLGNSDLSVSAVGLGTWAMGDDFFGRVDDSDSIAAIHAALDSGVTLIDTAPAYGNGHAEEVVGKALHGRDTDVVVATKCGIIRKDGEFLRNLKPASIRQEIEASLKRLQVDVIDLYQIHWPDKSTPLEETLEELMKIRESGKFRYLGVSNFSPKLMDQVHAITDIISVQPQYSMLDRRIEGDVLPYAISREMGVLSYGTLAGGILTGKYRDIPEFSEEDRRGHFYDFFREPLWGRIQELLDTLRGIAAERNVSVAQVAINWTIHQKGITAALVGAKRPDQAVSNAAGGSWKLTDDELSGITRAIDAAFGR
jgi:aryl-alcohol dehydrogenase-like predicted oxidoreductase